jgi:urease alpha subunit
MHFDIKIVNGTVYDGTGNGIIYCDIGINDSLITNMGKLSGEPADLTIDAAGCVVCPGFIDTHSHSDTYLLIEPGAASKVYQGITTEICGNCGASAAPLNGGYKMPSDWLDKDYSALPANTGNSTMSSSRPSMPPCWSVIIHCTPVSAAMNPAGVRRKNCG